MKSARRLLSALTGLLNRAGVLFALFLIQAYRILLAPFFVGGCRHHPSCSSYASEAFERHGFVKGLRLTATRLVRCRPGGTYGYDPVPKRTQTTG